MAKLIHRDTRTCLVVGVFLAAFSGATARATVDAGDFFCKSYMTKDAPPFYIASASKSCGDGTPQVIRGACLITALCAYVSDDTKGASKGLFQKDFSALTPEQRQTLVDSHTTNEEWVPSQLLCAGGKVANGNATCPAPDECKGDQFYGLVPAQFDADSLNRFKGRYDSGEHSFQGTGPVPPPATTGAAPAAAPKQ